MKKVFVVVVIVSLTGLGFLFFIREKKQVIADTQVAKYVDKEITVEGTLKDVRNNRKAVYLDFGVPTRTGRSG